MKIENSKKIQSAFDSFLEGFGIMVDPAGYYGENIYDGMTSGPYYLREKNMTIGTYIGKNNYNSKNCSNIDFVCTIWGEIAGTMAAAATAGTLWLTTASIDMIYNSIRKVAKKEYKNTVKI